MPSNSRIVIETVGANVLMVVGLYLSIVEAIAWIQYLTVGFIWMMLAMYLAVAFSKELRTKYQREPRNKISSSVGDFFDVAVVAALIASQWYLTACAYGASALVLRVNYGRIGFRSIKEP